MSRIRELKQQLEHRDFDSDTERQMLNWANWKTGAPIGLAVSSAYELEARGRREEMSIPLMNGEASDVDDAVEGLTDERLKLVVAEYWLRKGTIREKVRRCRCGSETFYSRLRHAHQLVREHLGSLRRAKQHLARTARAVNGGETPLKRRNKPV